MAAGVEVKGWTYSGVPHRAEHRLPAPWGWSWGDGWVWSANSSIISSQMETIVSGVNEIPKPQRKYVRELGQKSRQSSAYQGCRERGGKRSEKQGGNKT